MILFFIYTANYSLSLDYTYINPRVNSSIFQFFSILFQLFGTHIHTKEFGFSDTKLLKSTIQVATRLRRSKIIT